MTSLNPARTLLCLLVLCPALLSQSAAPAQSPAQSAAQPDPFDVFNTNRVLKGINLTIGTTIQHDSANGYSWVFDPDFAYRFNSAFSFEASSSIFSLINTTDTVNVGTKLVPVAGYAIRPKRGVAGDTALSAHMDIHPDIFDYSFTATLGAPTGSPAYGTGAGQVTYNFNNHFERSFGPFSPDLELGIGDSSSLTNTAVHKNYIAVGELAYFQLGTSVELPHHINFEADAFEQLPLARDTVYTTTGKGKRAVTTATAVGASEDNGFTTELDIPINKHVTFSGFYNRSLRGKIDTAGFGLTLSLRPPPPTDDDDVTPTLAQPSEK